MSPADAPVELRLRRLILGATDPASRAERAALIRRGAVPDPAVRESARATLADIREGGDDALREANERFGGGRPDGRLLLDRSELRAARDALEPRVRRALDQAIDHVRRFAEPQRPRSTRTLIAPGIDLERRWAPLASVGCYVPGGSAPYPSSLVMTVVPAQVAGVERIVVASPADRDGANHPVLLGAAGLLEVDAFVVAGGAQAIGALAYGLPDVGLEPVDRIVGPGNAWVTAAKIEVCGEVGIDLPAGPSEGMVLAAPPADPGRVAADLITQAEHGPDSPAILVTTDAAFADAVEAEVQARLATASRRDILEAALAAHGRIALAPDLDAAIDFVNAYGPEHLSVDVEPLEPTVARLRNAGSLFVGPWAPESAGDYATGANHVLPTGGLARSSGGLAVEAYGKFVQVQRIDREGLATIRDTIATLAEAEGLLAHRDAVDRALRRRRGARPMSPTPVTFTSPVARRLHLGGDRRGGRRALRRADRVDRPLRPEHVAHPAGPRRPPPGRGPVRDPAVRVPAVGLPPAHRRGSGPLRRRHATRSWSVPGRTRSSTSSPRRSSPGGPGRPPGPDLRDVPGDHRAARRGGHRRPAATSRRGLGDRHRRGPRGRRGSSVVWLCSPNNPTGLAEPEGPIESLLDGLAADSARTADRRPRRGVRRVRRDVAACRSARRIRTSSSSGRRARRMRSPACASGSRSPTPRSSPG